MARIELRALRKVYGEVKAVRGIDLNVAQGEFIALVGPSGCGKSTTLRMIAGLEDVTSGEVIIGERVVNEVAPKDRDVAMVFQNYALYPHMNVLQNISIALKLRKLPKGEIDRRVREAAEILEIGDLMNRRPKQLSGGQRQRVAMGRAIVRNPEVFLFDEPLSNLDAMLRVQMRTELKKIHQRLKTTVVYVTHDQVEAMTLADRIVVMNGGQIEQVATPQEMYDNPKTRFVAQFIGAPSMNIIKCQVARKDRRLVLSLGSEQSLAIPNALAQRYEACIGRDMLLGIRPEHITERRVHSEGTYQDFSSDIKVVEPLGVDTMVYIEINGQQVCGRASPHAVGRVGSPMPFSMQMDKMHLIDPATDLVV